MLPKERQTLFFSATMPQEITQLASQMLRDPAKVSVTPQSTTAEKVDQRVILTDRASKPGLLAQTLKAEKTDRVLVFTRTKHGADKVVRGLIKAGLKAEAIHGNKSQNQRERVLAAFRDGSVRTLVATDIAARGIDVDGISHVVNYDLPNIPESYVHRIGRTARAGATGVAISFCDYEEAPFLRDIERLIRMSIPATDARTGPRPAQRPAPDRHGRSHGHHNGKGRNQGHGNGQRHNGGRSQRNGQPRQNHRQDERGVRPQQMASTQPIQPRSKEQPGSIENVTFMQAPRRNAGDRAPR
jgi:superfamily II DNA/RNA helicase